MRFFSLFNIWGKKFVFLLSLLFCMNTFAATARTPIVFVHGLGGDAINFYLMKNYLKSQGWQDNELYALALPTKNGNQRLNSGYIRDSVNQIISSTGHSKVNIVAHSMGGANSLYYILFNGGQEKVDKLITLGGANKLTTNEAPQGVKVTSIYSTADMVVNPYLSKLYGAENIPINYVDHVSLLANAQVNQLILTALKK